jgi:hypothetical protein
MVFVDNSPNMLYLVWKRCLGGDFLVKTYQNQKEAIQKREQILKKGWKNLCWIQPIIFIKEVPSNIMSMDAVWDKDLRESLEKQHKKEEKVK